MNKIIWLTGHSGSGKTTIAEILAKELNAIVLDGDEMRESISEDLGLSKSDREENNKRIAKLAKVLSKRNNIIISVIAPIKKVREEITKELNPTWIYLKRELPERENHFYEESSDYFRVDIDDGTINQNVKKIIDYISPKKIYSLFIGRWQPLHEGHLSLFDKVRKEGKNILIGIRNTPISENDPYSVKERIEMIKEKVPDAEILVMPDIEEIVYGRKVGWGIREIRLDGETEKISATKIREKNK